MSELSTAFFFHSPLKSPLLETIRDVLLTRFKIEFLVFLIVKPVYKEYKCNLWEKNKTVMMTMNLTVVGEADPAHFFILLFPQPLSFSLILCTCRLRVFRSFSLLTERRKDKNLYNVPVSQVCEIHQYDIGRQDAFRLYTYLM